MKTKSKDNKEQAKIKLKRLKTIKKGKGDKIKQKLNETGNKKNLQKQIHSEIESGNVTLVAKKTENKFSRFVKSYNGKNLSKEGKKIVQFFRIKNLTLPRRTSKFVNLVKYSCGDQLNILNEDSQIITLFETLKDVYKLSLTNGKEEQSTAEKPKPSKNKRKKMARSKPKSEEISSSNSKSGESTTDEVKEEDDTPFIMAKPKRKRKPKVKEESMEF